ncbi:MAG TPA: hypothetical protein VHY33_05930 [Thermoanaerobaculia bacterium]|jgi:hypothetical protein|nr:hypothetical protein [Thermoanaerobaculia bacterium]
MRNATGKQACIQTLFLHPVESYSLAEGARLLGIAPATLRREAEDDRREEYRSGNRWRFSWRQLATIALRRWGHVEVLDTLGSDAATALPPLLALRTVTLRLPAYVVLALETIATEERRTLDDALHGELIDLAGIVADRMEAIHPGFRRAYLYPASRSRGEYHPDSCRTSEQNSSDSPIS